jgi:tRNA uridine 5-carboxymethylaminomethyl modification enzyme
MDRKYQFDLVVIGGGHAGVEAALAAARLGARTALLTSNVDTVGQMSCNPAIGGVAKGQLVREIDALGGAMARAIDATGIQFRVLNRRKGPAMHGPRAQADRKAYQQFVRRLVEEQPNVLLRQETVTDLLVEKTDKGLRAVGVRVRGGAVYQAEAVILCAGTFLRGILHYGPTILPGGRAAEPPVEELSTSLEALGFEIARFKTGTSPRLDGRTIDFDKLTVQLGDDPPQPFSFVTDRLEVDQLPCWITYTTPALHELLRANLHRAPLFTGQIQSVGPRYCPSVETKVVRFADKDRHQLFLEPEGRNTHEIYVNGLSTSVPRDVQDEMVRLVPGLERAVIIRYGYAIEYDYLPPVQLTPWLETKRVKGFFCAGQVNGTTGYEEAAAQGLIAGASAGLLLKGKDPLILSRDLAYIGVMIDDLVTRGVDEPYRMFTSRAEFRLRLRHDNADRRLTRMGYELGLVDETRYRRLVEKERQIEALRACLESLRIEGIPADVYLRRPEVTWDDLLQHFPQLAGFSQKFSEQVVYDIKYEGYIARQEAEIQRQRRLAEYRIPSELDYFAVPGLRFEAREKLARVRPHTLDQASRISGITPADIAVLVIHLSSRGRQGNKAPAEVKASD